MTATPYVAVHRLSAHGTINGGVVITPPDLTVTANWLEYYGLQPDDQGVVILYKAINDDWHSDRGADYSPGTTPEAEDWEPTNECGAGLHFSPRPHMTRTYSSGPRLVACPVRAEDIVVIGTAFSADKCKAPRVVAPGCWPVDEDGNRIDVSADGGVPAVTG